MTEAVYLGELLKRHSLALPAGGSTPRPSRVVWAWPDPLPTRLKRVGKNVDPMVGGARSITLYDAFTPSDDVILAVVYSCAMEVLKLSASLSPTNPVPVVRVLVF